MVRRGMMLGMRERRKPEMATEQTSPGVMRALELPVRAFRPAEFQRIHFSESIEYFRNRPFFGSCHATRRKD